VTNSLGTHPEHHPDDLPEYALGQLEPARHATVEAHLASCTLCTQEASRLAEAWSLMAFGVEPQVAPQHIIRKILADVRQRQSSASTIRQPSVAQADPSSSPGISLAANPSDVRLSWSTIGSYVLAATVLIGLVIGFQYSIWQGTSSEQAPSVALPITHDASELEADLQKMSRLQQAFGTPTVRLLTHQPSESTPRKSKGTVVWDLVSHQWHFFALHFAPLPPGKIYMLWWVDNAETAFPAASIEVDPNGNGKMLVSLPAEMNQIGKALVTIESTSPSPSPSNDIYMSFSWREVGKSD
jgi:Anti-sigma-K factor rskA/Putative zinc-finger